MNFQFIVVRFHSVIYSSLQAYLTYPARLEICGEEAFPRSTPQGQLANDLKEPLVLHMEVA